MNSFAFWNGNSRQTGVRYHRRQEATNRGAEAYDVLRSISTPIATSSPETLSQVSPWPPPTRHPGPGIPELGLGNCLNITQATRTDPRAESVIALKTWRMGNGPGPAKSSTARP